MTRRPLSLLFAAALAVTTFAGVADARFVGIGDYSVKFRATGPAGMKINGSSSDLSADEKDGKLTITAPLGNLKTGIDLRDEHLQRYLETSKFPNATLTVARSALTVPDNDQTHEGEATGEFTLHGVTRSTKFKYKAKRTGSDYHVDGRATVNINDFGIETPCYLGVCTQPEVKLAVHFKLRDQD